MATIVNVIYKAGKDLPEVSRKANKIGETDFAEITVENSEPTVKVTQIPSPSKRVKQILEDKGVKIIL
jgi:hypothetical protein